jgi:hypothetical protein
MTRASSRKPQAGYLGAGENQRSPQIAFRVPEQGKCAAMKFCNDTASEAKVDYQQALG